MARKIGVCRVLSVLAFCLTGLGAWYAVQPTRGSVTQGPKGSPASPADGLERRFVTRVQPFV